jgi:hypothetical protein
MVGFRTSSISRLMAYKHICIYVYIYVCVCLCVYVMYIYICVCVQYQQVDDLVTVFGGSLKKERKEKKEGLKEERR